MPREPGWKGKDDKDFEKVRFRLPIKTNTGWLLQDPVPLEDNGNSQWLICLHRLYFYVVV